MESSIEGRVEEEKERKRGRGEIGERCRSGERGERQRLIMKQGIH